MLPVLKKQKTITSNQTDKSLDLFDFETYVESQNEYNFPDPELNSKHVNVAELNSYRKTPNARNFRVLEYSVSRRVTALVVRIEGFESLSDSTCVMKIAEIVSELYQQVDEAGCGNGVQVVDRRNDRFVFIADDSEQINSNVQSFGQLLAVAVDLHKRLPATQALQCHTNLKLTMGIASGSAVLLCAGREGAWEATSTLGLQGDAVHTASAMAGLAAAGTVAVDGSALWQWAAAARSLPPPSSVVECEGGERRRAAVFDLCACAFEQAPPPPPPGCRAIARTRGEAEAEPPRRSVSLA